MLFEVESHHDGATDTFHFLCSRVDDALNEVKTFSAYFCNGGLHCDMVGTVNLCDEVGFDVDNNNAVFLTIHVRTHRSEVFGLA